MIRASIARASSFAQLAAAGLVALSAARFGTAGVLFAIREQAPTLESAAAPAPPPPPPATRAPEPRPPASAVKSGTTLRVPLVVTLGPDRSEVRADGVKLGNTPYVGEVTCKAGESIRIDVTPPRGVPTSHEKRCAPGTLRVGD